MSELAVAAAEACTRCATPLEPGDLRCAVCAMARPAAAAPPPAATRARVLRCTACGAAVSFVAEAQAPRCSFCLAVMRVEEPVDPVEQAEVLVPFTVERAAAQAALRTWLGGRGWFAPPDLASAAAIDTMQPLHWAAWLVDGRALVSWAADSDEGSRSSSWAPHAGAEHMRFDHIVVSASRGLSHVECAELVGRYDLSGARPVRDEDDGVVERFDAQRSAARKQVVAAIEATAAARLQRGSIPGRRFRKVHVSVLLEELTTRRVALPVWVLAYRYRGTPYRALVHGHDAAGVIGQAPISWWRVLVGLVAVLAVLAVIVGVLAAVMN